MSEELSESKPLDTQEVVSASGDSVESLTQRIKELETELQDKQLRAHAEMQNMRRRFDVDMQNARKYSIEKLLQELLPVIDSLEMAASVLKVDDPAAEGIKMTLKLFSDTLEKQGVVAIEAMGQSFDPSVHEAMATVEVAAEQNNRVVQVYQRGYSLNGRVVRPARVVVGRAPAEN